jgi:hypothetical protein
MKKRERLTHQASLETEADEQFKNGNEVPSQSGKLTLY